MSKKDNLWKLAETWKNMRHPPRPSQKNQEVYEKYIKEVSKRENPKMLVLGSTPSIRDLANKHGVDITVIDNNPRAYKALKMLKEREGDENFVKQDWEEMDIEKKFDLIMGDTALNMLKWEQYSNVIENIREHLKSDGLYVERMPSRIRQNISENEFASWLKRLKDEFGSKFVQATSYPILLFSTENGREEMKFTDCGKNVKPLYEKGKISKEIYEAIDEYGNSIPIRFCFPQRKELFDLLRDEFEISKVIECQEIEDRTLLGSDLSPIVVCKPK